MAKKLKDIIKKAGGLTAVANACGVSPPAVSKWIRAGELPGKDYLKTVEGYRKKISEMSGVDPKDIPW